MDYVILGLLIWIIFRIEIIDSYTSNNMSNIITRLNYIESDIVNKILRK